MISGKRYTNESRSWPCCEMPEAGFTCSRESLRKMASRNSQIEGDCPKEQRERVKLHRFYLGQSQSTCKKDMKKVVLTLGTSVFGRSCQREGPVTQTCRRVTLYFVHNKSEKSYLRPHSSQGNQSRSAGASQVAFQIHQKPI